MNPADLLATPPPTHLVYIPFILVIGFIIGFVVGRRQGGGGGRDEHLEAGGDDDLL